MATAQKSKLVIPMYNHWEKLTDEDLRRCLLDFEEYCKHKIIINKQGHAVPFILNEAQREVAKLILPLVFAKIPEPVTLVIHKSRQEGISVLLAALEQYIAARKKNINLTHLFPTDDLAKSFFQEKWLTMLEGTHPQLLPDCYATTSPPYVKVRDFLGTNMGDNIRISSAESRAGSRGQTNQVVILDEYAYYGNVSNIERGVLATQPKTGMVLTIYVSTANGANHFYDVIKQAQQPKSRIKHLFLPWHMLKEYEIAPDENSRFYDLSTYTPTEYDLRLMDVFEERGYPVESWIPKMNFYDVTMEKEAKGDQDYMFENYPTTPEESFSATGRPVLPAKAINFWLDQEHPTVYIDQFLNEKTNRIEMLQTTRSAIKQFKPPIRGHKYWLAIDPSSGYAADRSAGAVVDMDTLEEVAFFSDYIDQTELAELAVNLGTYYNRAVIVPERNMGETLIEFIKQLGYPRLYIDSKNSSRVIKYGIRTTVPVKNEAIRRLKFLLNNGLYKPHDIQFLKEAQHFNWVALPSGGYKAQATGVDDDGQPWHDDAVCARLMVAMVINMGKFKKYMQTKRVEQGF